MMIYHKNCQKHNKLLTKICKINSYYKLRCDFCVLQQEGNLESDVIIFLTSNSLKFFQTFLGYSYYKIFQWIEEIRKNGLFSVFQRKNNYGSFSENQTNQEQLKAIGIMILEDHLKLTQNNRQFVLNNRNNDNLYHPQFLKDIFKLITEPWEVSSLKIIKSLQFLAHQRAKLPQKQCQFAIKNQFSDVLQTYRVQLMSKICKNTIFSIHDLRNFKKQADNITQIQTTSQASNRTLGYQLPYSIQKIQSYEQIGERRTRAHKTSCSLFNENSCEHNFRQQSDDTKITQLKLQLQFFKLQNKRLEEENKLLKLENFRISKLKNDALLKLEYFQKQNKENNRIRAHSFIQKKQVNLNNGISKIRIVK